MSAEDSDRLARMVRERPPRCGATRLVCVDGPAGSGKSTLGADLARRLAAGLVGLDDLYDGWTQPLGSVLAGRLGAWLLIPWRDGLPGRYLRFDWRAGRYREWVEVPLVPVMIIEGCGAASAGMRPWATLSIWMEASAELRLLRGLDRDGTHLAADWAAWQRHEDEHFASDGTRAAADVLVDGITGAIIRP